jgi:ATP-dependent Clp protease ATP-binding subunit ClpC
MSLDGFGPSARAAVTAAVDEARRLGSARVGTEHLLLGLLAVEDGAAAGVLRDIGIGAAAVRRKVGETSLGAGGGGGDDDAGRARGAAARSPRAERALGRAHRFAHAAHSPEARTDHLLLGVLDVEGTAGQVLRGLGVDVDRLRARLLALPPGVGDGEGAAAASAAVSDGSAAAVVSCPSCGADLAVIGVTVAEVPVADGTAAKAYACAACATLLGIRGLSGAGGR